jgi:outer membrane murein-binding lipoprotein Lpp
MGNKNILIPVLIILLIGVIIFAGMMYNKTTLLNSEIDKLNSQVSGLNDDKSKLVEERDSLMSNLTALQSKTKMLEEDVTAIYSKTCHLDNVCKGHYPGIRWLCNNVGDLADNNTASHTCICDVSCQLNATEIRRS